jgi:phage tail-like protein
MTAPRNDPFPAYNFYVSLTDASSGISQLLTQLNIVVAGGFSECTGLEAVMTVEDHIEGGENTYVHKFCTRMTYSHIVLKRGVTFSTDLWDWHMSWIQGKGKRRDGIIALCDEQQQQVRAWSFHNGLPSKWTGPTFHASQNAVAFEAIDIVHEGWAPQPAILSLQQFGSALAGAGSAVANLF